MFYVSRLKGKMIGVIDTDDGVEDFLTPTDVLLAEKQGNKIEGIIRVNGKVYFIPMTPITLQLSKLQRGIPVRVKLTKGLDFKQTIFMGSKFDENRKDVIFYFFDDSGVEGSFGISCQFALNHKSELQIDLNNNDPMRVTTLIKRLQDSADFKL